MVTSLIHDQDTLDELERVVFEHLPPPTRRTAFRSSAARGPYPGDDEPTEVRRRPVAPPPEPEPWAQAPPTQPDVRELAPADLWQLALQDPSVIVAAATAALAFALSFGAGSIGFVLGILVG